VVFTQAVLGTVGRSRFLRSPRFLGAGERRVDWHFDFTGMSKWFFSFSGLILAIGAISFATEQLNLGIDFESGTRINVSLEEPATVEEVRSVLSGAGVEGAGDAAIQEVDDPAFGENVLKIETDLAPDQVGEAQTALDDQYGLAGGDDGFQSTSIGPTFGEQVAKNAAYAIIFSLLVISAYVAWRFEAKYAVPVLIALFHDILITGAVYSLVGAEVSSATVAAFLTILGYSLYDCIIVFDRIRENVPRMPRAAFSQIVNRSMSEVLTRSLITGLSTIFLIACLLVFGGETLKSFALAMMIGVASGTYSSIFIASPVLTAWKEREHSYRSRRARIEDSMGYVPAFPEENVVAKVSDDEPEGPADTEAAPPAKREATPPAPPPPPVATAQDADGAGDGADGAAAEEDELVGAGADPLRERAREQRRRRQQRKRRKHGRNR
jgi:SecD/SecF fusion protein